MLTDTNEKGKKALFILLITAGILTSAFLLYKVYRHRSAFWGQSGLSVSVSYGDAEVYFDDSKLGNTPYQSWEVKPGSHLVKVKGPLNSYEATIPFTTNSREVPQVVINRDLGISRSFSSGQNFWIDYKDLSSKISLVSEPSQATVFIDDAEVGKTPYSSSVLSDGEYDLRVEKAGFEPQTARVKIKKNYKLNVSVQLFLIPVPDKSAVIPGSKVVYDLSSDLNELTLDVPLWVNGIVYWNKTRNTALKFSYFIDYLGNIYGADGSPVTGNDKFALKAGDTIAYLGRKSDSGLTNEAKTALERFTGIDLIGKKVKVLSTGTGWLRVRSEPSLTASEIGRINSGDEVSVLEERTEWLKVLFGDGKEGWVSSSYVVEVRP
ncbi:hypothetical protein A2716_02670 [candidate division WWE3 bacterium RIFCSPHIGHO2_01_FULL_40_23]|uniref:Uncharacterized protein n=1 Tax=candidate division WWE3 bacterium RIFCSPLOWO2_01_FULL_41_18 TaxID=1802625 RepID=A0A1F4VFJ0_UNCKA|nr:MAG: hypothetical protein A2716_02670 [candidate division WWE3 bacterium RIFCSPHIGHO2_01_FULL_40_23]OGC55889.1 MAG: hypothetical protein A3A78_02520 [candidate division WWE3 bacterium RIFCSPLOWO2_01_FULL_41_18]